LEANSGKRQIFFLFEIFKHPGPAVASLQAERASWKKERAALARTEQELRGELKDLQEDNQEGLNKIHSLQSEVDRLISNAKQQATNGSDGNAQLIGTVRL